MRFFLFLEVRLNFRYRFYVFSLSDYISFLCNCFSDKDVRVLKGGKKKKVDHRMLLKMEGEETLHIA